MDLATIVKAALASLLRTAAGMLALAIATSALCGWLASSASPARGALAGAIGFVAVAIAGALLSVKRAVLRALLAGLQRLGLASSACKVIFERILGGPDGKAASLANRIPLAQAEQRLRGAVGSLRGLWPDVSGARWVQRRVESWLIVHVERLTLARFREEGQREGAIDLARVQGEVAAQADALLAGQVAAAITKVTLLAIVASVGGAVLLALVLRQV